MNAGMKILILEDEKLNAERIERLLFDIRTDIEIVGVVTSIKKAVSWFSANNGPDLILMDVKLADGLSFELFNRVHIECPVIFTTAYDEFAIKAFKFNSIDYLLKPIDSDELAFALSKFDRTARKSYLGKPVIEELIARVRPKKYRNRFLIPYRDTYRKVDVSEIAFFHSFQNICYAHLFTGEKVSIPHILESLDRELDPGIFFRANRQYIVHINAIESVHDHFNGKLKLHMKKQGTDIMVSRIRAPRLKAWLDY